MALGLKIYYRTCSAFKCDCESEQFVEGVITEICVSLNAIPWPVFAKNVNYDHINGHWNLVLAKIFWQFIYLIILMPGKLELHEVDYAGFVSGEVRGKKQQWWMLQRSIRLVHEEYLQPFLLTCILTLTLVYVLNNQYTFWRKSNYRECWFSKTDMFVKYCHIILLYCCKYKRKN